MHFSIEGLIIKISLIEFTDGLLMGHESNNNNKNDSTTLALETNGTDGFHSAMENGRAGVWGGKTNRISDPWHPGFLLSPKWTCSGLGEGGTGRQTLG